MQQKEVEKQIRQKCNFLASFLIKKNRDYKGASFDLGLTGNIVHLWDKIKRYKNLVLDKHKPYNESTQDTIRDIAGYAILGLIIYENENKQRKS